MRKFICVANCPELDCEGGKHCEVKVEWSLSEIEKDGRDFCPCGNYEKWEEVKITVKELIEFGEWREPNEIHIYGENYMEIISRKELINKPSLYNLIVSGANLEKECGFIEIDVEELANEC